MANTKRRTARSNTSSKSSEPQTKKLGNESPESTKESDETSTQTTTKDSSPSTSDDENDALFAEADAEADADQDEDIDPEDEGAAENDAEESDEDQDEDEDSEPGEGDPEPSGDHLPKKAPADLLSTFGVHPEGDLHTFNVVDDRGSYTFHGYTHRNVVIVAEAAFREFSLPGTSRTTQVQAHHRGEIVPLANVEKFSTTKIKKD